MDHEFWLGRWREGRTPFHEGVANRFLVAHHDRIAACRRVLVPLCGKAEDLAYLAARGHDVVGIELAADAIDQFFAEHAITPAVSDRAGLRVYEAGAITLLAGDFFATTRESVGSIDGVYDRGAIVALPPDTHPRYATHLRALAPAMKRQLLIALEYPPGAYDGPPFTVTVDELRALYPDAAIELVDQGRDPRNRADGKMFEFCYDLRF